MFADQDVCPDLRTGRVVLLKQTFGFLETETGASYFFHAGAVYAPLRFADLREGDAVSFFEEWDPKGIRATGIQAA